MIAVACTATKHVELHHQGIDTDIVGSNLLQSGGDMVLKLNGYDVTATKNFSDGPALHFYIISTIKSNISLKMFKK